MDYKIMHKDKIIALGSVNRISKIIEESLCPVCFSSNVSIDVWLANRSIDTWRPHSRKLFKALRLRTPDDIEQVIDIGHGISITDNWWIQRNDEELDYRSLKQYNEELSDIALYGSSASNSGNTKGYRELGTVGSYEKAWRYINGYWSTSALSVKSLVIIKVEVIPVSSDFVRFISYSDTFTPIAFRN